MNKIKQVILDYLTEWLQEWFVPQEDYRYVQSRRVDAEFQVKKAHEELNYFVNEVYTKQFQSFEDYGLSIKVDYIETNDVELQAFEYRYHFRIPHRRYIVMKSSNLYKIYLDMKTEVIDRLTNAFKKHMTDNLFSGLK